MVTLPLGLGVATPGLTVVGFLVLARGWLLDRRRAERLSAMLDRADMSPREVVAHAGLDPRPRQSGARDAKRQIRRVWSGGLRAALFRPARVAARGELLWVRAMGARRNTLKRVATVAGVRRLGALWVVILREEPFAPEKFGPKAVTAE